MPSATTDEITQGVQAIKEKLLGILQSHDTPPKKFQGLSPDDLEIRLYSTQGVSRVTYEVTCKSMDEEFILSVYRPDAVREKIGRSNIHAAHEFQNYLASKNVPVPAPIGDIFTLNPPLDYPCELIPFVHGYQIPPKGKLALDELDSYAQLIAQAHLVSQNYIPSSLSKPRTVLSTHLPHGFVQYDSHQGNLIFDQDTHQVKALIDFEDAHYDTFARDLAHLISTSFISIKVTSEGVKMNFDQQQATRFLETYSKIRPLSKAEAQFIDKEILADNTNWIHLCNTTNAKEPPLSETLLESEIIRIRKDLKTFSANAYASGKSF